MTLVLLLAIAINCLVLFGEHRAVEVARREVTVFVAAAVPGMVLGAWLVTEADRDLLQLLVGAVVLPAPPSRRLGRRRTTRRGPALEIGGGVTPAPSPPRSASTAPPWSWS